ncbi:uncharacterized protein FIBRA_02504 [Fibroporia radiculosa]|uniref:Uncharacterized protein n=1 Tax=Fibroporia radiculosa TaxID=599839 RepID=J4I935_9APHY|nr:uncharacterized protein FIBRA_02504 [Fibroporia radiculosa]CCM00471.1 predicted protein [Fibroporia radiculosa]
MSLHPKAYPLAKGSSLDGAVDLSAVRHGSASPLVRLSASGKRLGLASPLVRLSASGKRCRECVSFSTGCGLGVPLRDIGYGSQRVIESTLEDAYSCVLEGTSSKKITLAITWPGYAHLGEKKYTFATPPTKLQLACEIGHAFSVFLHTHGKFEQCGNAQSELSVKASRIGVEDISLLNRECDNVPPQNICPPPPLSTILDARPLHLYTPRGDCGLRPQLHRLELILTNIPKTQSRKAI